VEPEFEKIAGGDYKISRSLFFYVKQQHVGFIPGIEEFVREFTSERAWGPDGYLIDKGLIPLPDADRRSVAQQAQALIPLSM
jgi:phosphate transport system substrate-binding protein